MIGWSAPAITAVFDFDISRASPQICQQVLDGLIQVKLGKVKISSSRNLTNRPAIPKLPVLNCLKP